MFIFERERRGESACARAGEGQGGGGDRGSKAGSALTAARPDAGLELMNCKIMT